MSVRFNTSPKYCKAWCKKILFDENLFQVEVSLLKDGNKNGPEVKSITLNAQVGSDKNKLKTYKCGSYKLSASDKIKSNFCQSQTVGSQSTTTARSASGASLTKVMLCRVLTHYYTMDRIHKSF